MLCQPLHSRLKKTHYGDEVGERSGYGAVTSYGPLIKVGESEEASESFAILRFGPFLHRPNLLRVHADTSCGGDVSQEGGGGAGELAFLSFDK